MSVYPAFASDVDTLKNLYSHLPAAARAAMGLSHIDTNTQFSFLNFYGNIFPFFMLAGSIQAMLLGVGILSREVRSKTTDFLLSKPIRRRTIFLSKYAAALTSLVVTGIAFVAMTFIGAKITGAGSFSMTTYLLITAVFSIVQLVFLSLGLLVSQLIKKIKSPASISLAVTLGLFITGTLGIALGEDKVRYLSPFKYVDFLYVIDHKAYEWQYLVAGISLFITCIVMSYLLYIRRDRRAVD